MPLDPQLPSVEAAIAAAKGAERAALLDPRNETDRLAIARHLYAWFCFDLANHPEVAASRMIALIQVVLRDAVDGHKFVPMPIGKVGSSD